jgi:xanthine dehydrogenase YagS FAD-binding subunit
VNDFEWITPKTLDEAVARLRPRPNEGVDEAPQAFAGGQDLLTVLKDGIARPARLVNLKSIPGLDRIERRADGGLNIGASVELWALEAHALVERSYPGLAEAAGAVGSPQIRSLATVGGNLCQRPRCWYFRNPDIQCLKKGGDECYAESGENKYNAILGGGPSHFVHPSDLAPMLVALGAEVSLYGPSGARRMPLEAFFRLPADHDLRRENVLEPGEIVTSIHLPAPSTGARSTYLKFKERGSLDFALASVALALELDKDRVVREAHIVLGGVAPIPWRARSAESHLRGRALSEDVAKEVATRALEGARPLSKNAYKVPLAKAVIRRALQKLEG